MKQKLLQCSLLLFIVNIGFAQLNHSNITSSGSIRAEAIIDDKRSFTRTNDKEIIEIDIASDVNWDNEALLHQLGVKTLTIERGKCAIMKDAKYPYGIVELKVKAEPKANGTQFIKPFLGPWQFNAGVTACDLPGFLCCSMGKFELDRVIITPLLEDSNLVKLQIQFLTEEITNGKKFLANTKEELSTAMPNFPFVITYFKEGKYTSNNDAFLNARENEVLLRNFLYLGQQLKFQLKENLTLTIDAAGKVTSSDQSIVKNYSNAIVLFNSFNIHANIPVTITVRPGSYTITGVNSKIKNSKAFLSKIEQGIKNIQKKLGGNKAFVMKIDKTGRIFSSNQKLVRNGNPIKENILVANEAMKWSWDEYKGCVGEYWYLPGIAQVACAVGCAVACGD